MLWQERMPNYKKQRISEQVVVVVGEAKNPSTHCSVKSDASILLGQHQSVKLISCNQNSNGSCCPHMSIPIYMTNCKCKCCYTCLCWSHWIKVWMCHCFLGSQPLLMIVSQQLVDEIHTLGGDKMLIFWGDKFAPWFP